MRRFSDGVDRPDSYDGTSLARGMEQYFAAANDKELARLRAENELLRRELQVRSTFPAKAAAA